MILTPIQLPQPYSYLLTQPLLTIAIEHYYGAAPMIKLVAENLNLHNNLYYRTIIMMLKNRIIAERAGIVMNFNELPHPLIKQILNTNIPFGRLLYEAHVPIISQYQNLSTVVLTPSMETKKGRITPDISLVGDPKTFPHHNLDITAVVKKTNTIMAVQHKHYPIYGIQFHPESIGTPTGKIILRNFLDMQASRLGVKLYVI